MNKTQIIRILVLIAMGSIVITLGLASLQSLIRQETQGLPLEAMPLAMAIAFKLIAGLTAGIKYKKLLMLHNLRVDYYEAQALAGGYTLLKYITPFHSSHIPRAAYLQKFHNLPYSSYTAQTILVSTLEALIAIGICAFLWLSGLKISYQFNVAYISILVAALVLLICAIKWQKSKTILASVWESILTPLVRNPKQIMILLALIFASIIFRAAGIFWCLRALSEVVEPSIILMTEGLRTLGTIIPITPGGIGISEGIVGLALVFYGVPISIAISAALLSRLLSVAIHAFLGLLFVPYLMRMLRLSYR